MATYCGTVKKNDIEGGIWELHADDGEHYQLRGGSDDLRRDGQAVTVEGTIDKAGFGIGMTGPILDVSSWSSR